MRKKFILLILLIGLLVTVPINNHVEAATTTNSAVTSFKITYKLNGGKNNTKNPSTFTKSTKTIKLENPTKKGYTFKGWYTDSKFKVKITTIKKGTSKNITLYAKWVSNTYSIKFNWNSASSGAMPNLKNIKYGTTITLPKNTYKKDGYVFVGWNTKRDGSGTTYKNKAKVKNLTTKDKATISLYAMWQNTFKIKYELNGGINNKSNPTKYKVTKSVTLKNPTRKNYIFKGWYTDALFKNKITTIKKGSSKNLTLYAKWEPKDFKTSINSEKLKPIKTRYVELDKQLDKIIAKVTKGKKTNYEKLQAIYAYVRDRFTYDIPIVNLQVVQAIGEKYHYTYNDAYRLYLAKYGVDNTTGSCDIYSSLFMVLARRLGFDAYAISGTAPNRKTGRSGHTWVTIKSNGKYYLFDPQIEASVGSKFYYFGKTDKELPIYEGNRDAYVKSFNHFKEVNKLSVNIKMSGARSETYKMGTYTTTTRDVYKSGTNINDKINFKISLSGAKEYTYTITENNTTKTIKSGTTKKDTLSFSFKYTKKGYSKIKIRIAADGKVIYYYWATDVRDPGEILFNSPLITHECGNSTTCLEYSPYGGYEPYTYTSKIIETDDTGSKSKTNSNYLEVSGNRVVLHYKKGCYYKIKTTVKDKVGTTFSSETIIQK